LGLANDKAYGRSRHFVFLRPAEMGKRRMDSGASKIPRKGLRWPLMGDRSAQESRALQRANIARLIGHPCEGCDRPDGPNGTGRNPVLGIPAPSQCLRTSVPTNSNPARRLLLRPPWLRLNPQDSDPSRSPCGSSSLLSRSALRRCDFSWSFCNFSACLVRAFRSRSARCWR